jgi:TusA-related sulfurtransferase
MNAESEMSLITELDLRGVGLPVSLLKFKRAMDNMESEDALEVLVEDPGVVEDFVKIIRRSKGRMIRPHREGDHYRIHIGANPKVSP